MRVLVTGASGMLGCTLVPFLESQGHTIIRHSRNSPADVICDLTNCAETSSMLEMVQPECLVNLVAATNVDECERSPHSAYLLNTLVVENLVAGLAARDGMFLVQISTDQVYDSIGESNEGDVKLTNTYALTKYAGELAALRMRSAVLRTNFFGASMHPTRKSLSDWLLDNFCNRKKFTAFTDVKFTPLSITTLCSVIEMVLRKQVVGVFNVGSHFGMSKADFAETLAQVFQLSSASMLRGYSNDSSLEAYRPKNMCMNSTKFEVAYGIALPCLSNEIKQLSSETNDAA